MEVLQTESAAEEASISFLRGSFRAHNTWPIGYQSITSGDKTDLYRVKHPPDISRGCWGLWRVESYALCRKWMFLYAFGGLHDNYDLQIVTSSACRRA